MTKDAPKTSATTDPPTGPATPAAPRVLGDLLRADPAAPHVPEQEWVALVRAMAAGDESALRALYERTHRLAFTLIMRLTHDRQAAEELTLDVFHDAWRRAAGYDPANGTVLGWIMNQARSRAIDRMRYENRQKRVDPLPHDAPDAVEAGEAEDSLDREELTARLRAASGVLTPPERQALESAYFSDLTHAEIAARTGEPLGTIKSRIRSALAKLRRQLAPGKEAS